MLENLKICGKTFSETCYSLKTDNERKAESSQTHF